MKNKNFKKTEKPHAHISYFYGSRNKGDLLMLCGLMQCLKDVGYKTITISTLYDPDKDKESVPLQEFTSCLGKTISFFSKVRILISYFLLKKRIFLHLVKILNINFKDAFKCIDSADIVITTGGPFAHENTKAKFGISYSSLNFLSFFIELRYAELKNKPFIIMGQSFGSVQSKFAKSEFRDILNKSRHCIARESGGINLLKKTVVLDKPIKVLPDLGFYPINHSDQNSLSALYLSLKNKQNKRKYVLVNLRSMDEVNLSYLLESTDKSDKLMRKTYIDTLVGAIDNVLQQNKNYFFLFFTQAANNDEKISSIVVDQAGLDKNNCEIMPHSLNIQQVKQIFSLCHCAVTTRYHSLIYSLICNVPVLSLRYSPKISYMLNDFDLDVPQIFGESFTSEEISRFVMNANESIDIIHIQNLLKSELTKSLSFDSADEL